MVHEALSDRLALCPAPIAASGWSHGHSVLRVLAPCGSGVDMPPHLLDGVNSTMRILSSGASRFLHPADKGDGFLVTLANGTEPTRSVIQSSTSSRKAFLMTPILRRSL